MFSITVPCLSSLQAHLDPLRKWAELVDENGGDEHGFVHDLREIVAWVLLEQVLAGNIAEPYMQASEGCEVVAELEALIGDGGGVIRRKCTHFGFGLKDVDDKLEGW